MAYTKKKVVLGTTDNSTTEEFNKFNEFVVGIITKMINNKLASTRQLAKIINKTTIIVYLKSDAKSKVDVKYQTGEIVNINKSFTKETDVQKEFDKLVLK